MAIIIVFFAFYFRILLITFIQSLGSQYVMLPPRESLAAFDALAEARRQLQNTESW